MILKRIEGEQYSEVLPQWAGQTAVIMGGGYSLTREQVRRVQAAHADGRARCVVVNDCYLVASWADVHYAADAHWHRWHAAGLEKPVLGLNAAQVREMWATFPGQKCTIQSSGATVVDDAVHMLRNTDHPRHGVGLSLNPGYLVTGRNSGFQAMNLAVLAGAKRLLLIGFDGQPGIDGRDHFHGGHPRPTSPAAYPIYRQAMTAAAGALREAGVEVLNCSPGTAIDAFPVADLETVL